PERVSHDDQKKPEDKPKEEKPVKNPEETDPLAKYRRKDQDEDLEVGDVKDEHPGVFDPDAPVGWAEETKGDPYFRQLISDLREGWEYPTILEDAGTPVGCMRLEPDGRISDTLFKKKSGNDEL